MEYLIVFLEGIVTFISPCLLPLLPLYVSYFAGGSTEKIHRKPLINALGFVTGFTLVFICLGAFAGTLGRFVVQYGTFLNVATGGIVIIFGIGLLGLFHLPILGAGKSLSFSAHNMTPLKSIVFGIVFSISWTPCVSAFLGSALLLASQQGSAGKGVLMLFLFSTGLAIPFIISAILIDRLKTTFDFLKKHCQAINYISGVILILMGVMMMTGRLL